MDIDTPMDLDPVIVAAPGALNSPDGVVIPATTDRDRVLPALCLGSFVASLTYLAPSPLFADMAQDLGVGVPLLGQVVTGMLLLSAPLALVTGPLADRHGHRPLILIGLLAATICLLTFGLAPVFAVLFIASVFGALADACVPGLSLSVAGSYFQGAAARRAIGWTIG